MQLNVVNNYFHTWSKSCWMPTAVCFTMQIRSALALMQTIYWTNLYMVRGDEFTKDCRYTYGFLWCCCKDCSKTEYKETYFILPMTEYGLITLKHYVVFASVKQNWWILISLVLFTYLQELTWVLCENKFLCIQFCCNLYSNITGNHMCNGNLL
jgi:hypothetical protein